MQNKRISKGVQKYLEFHQMEPKKVAKFNPSVKIPSQMRFGGQSIDIVYASTKWNDDADYIHEHEPPLFGLGVCTYFPVTSKAYSNQDDDIEDVPVWLQDETVFIKLGKCLSFRYETSDGIEVEANSTQPYPDLYCTPCGKALLVIQGKSQILAVIWGGILGVTERGIVG